MNSMVEWKEIFTSRLSDHGFSQTEIATIYRIEMELREQNMFADMAMKARLSEIELLKNKALGAMGTEQEMKFSDIETGMLRASLSDGRKALKEIVEKTPVEVPLCNDGTKMKNQGRKKKHNDDSGGY